MGLRDLFRSKSKARSAKDQPTNGEPTPPVPSQQPSDASKLDSSGPLPLLRPDSLYGKLPASSIPPQSAGDPYSYTDPQGRELGGASFAYDSAKPGDAPHQGTLPLHGNAPARMPSETRRRSTSRKAHGRSISMTSSSRRPPASDNRSPSVNRRSMLPGTAVTTDEPITRTYSFNSHSSAPPESVIYHERASSRNVYTNTSSATTNNLSPVKVADREPVQTLVNEWEPGKGLSQLNSQPAVPVIPGQYRPNGISSERGVGSASATSAPPWKTSLNRHERVDSASSRFSTSSRTPIADEFASSSWYGRPGTPTAPVWSEVHGAREIPAPPPFTNQDPSLPSPQPPNLQGSGRPDPEVRSVTASSTTSNPDDRRTPPSRGRQFRRSYDRNLPVPKELRNAPWNRPENAQYTLQPENDDDDNNNNNNNGDIRDTAVLSSNSLSNSGFPSSRQVSNSSNIMNNVPVQSDNYSNVRQGQQTVYSKQPAVQGSAEPPSLDGIVDLRNTEDTTVYTRMAPAVTQETVQPTVHNIREEQITREIHTHDVHHRVLPVVDVQVLPSKHFVPNANGDGFYEVPAESIPGRNFDSRTAKNWVVAETVSKLPQTVPGSSAQTSQPRSFTARAFGPTEGNREEWIGSDGVKRTKQTWIHPPTVAEAPIENGITKPLQIPPPVSPPSQQASNVQSSSRSSMPVSVPNRSSSKRTSDTPNLNSQDLRAKSQPQSNAVPGPSTLSSNRHRPSTSSTSEAAVTAAREAVTVHFASLELEPDNTEPAALEAAHKAAEHNT